MTVPVTPIHESVRGVDVVAEAGVPVVGSGPAGIAAAISLHTGASFDRLDIGRVRRELTRRGARLE